MVGVPGRSKGCVTCRKRKKGVSGSVFGEYLRMKAGEGQEMNDEGALERLVREPSSRLQKYVELFQVRPYLVAVCRLVDLGFSVSVTRRRTVTPTTFPQSR